MNEQLFRKKSIDRVSSPEQLDAYIRVASPALWMVLVAIVVLLVGVCVWGVLGHLDTTVDAVAVCLQDGVTTVYVKEMDASKVSQGMPVKIGKDMWTVTGIAAQPMVADDSLSAYTLHVGGMQTGEWIFAVQTDAQLPEGIYGAQIVVESVSPMSFVMN